MSNVRAYNCCPVRITDAQYIFQEVQVKFGTPSGANLSFAVRVNCGTFISLHFSLRVGMELQNAMKFAIVLLLKLDMFLFKTTPVWFLSNRNVPDTEKEVNFNPFRLGTHP